MLTPMDDYPLHQTAMPIAHPGSGDPNHYDRYFFNGYDVDGGFMLAAAMGAYPNRQTIDAAFAVVHDGVEHSVFASGRLPDDRRDTSIGPVTVVVDEPMRRLRVVVDAPDRGIEAEVAFAARTIAVEEPRQTIVQDSRLVMDYTRLTQWGAWEGQIRVHGTELEVTADRTLGTRDRSWGVRPVGDPPPTRPSARLPEIFWLWAPLNFDDCVTHLALFEHADGRRWMESAAVVDVLAGPDAPTWGVDDAVEEVEDLRYEIEWEPGTRQSRSASVSFTSSDGPDQRIELTPQYTFRMRGIGYTHPDWGHGKLHGDLDVGSESVPLEDFDPLDPSSIHIQQVVTARWGERTGVGVLEQLAFGPHEPTGLTGFLDGA